MDLKVNHNSFIKLKDFFKLLDISVEVDEYSIRNDLLEGVLVVRGKYLKRDNTTEEYYDEKIPFTIAFATNSFEVDDINCLDLEYVAIDGRGVDVSFDILIKYEDTSVEEAIEVPVEVVLDREANQNEETLLAQDVEMGKDENIEEVFEDIEDKEIQTMPLPNEDFEELKEEETKRIDNLLKSTLEIKDDNHPTEEVVIRGLKEEKTSISVCYYKSDNELEKLCNNRGVSLDKVFKNNQKYNINQYHRVIINEK